MIKCSFCGILNDNSEIASQMLEEMVGKLQHRCGYLESVLKEIRGMLEDGIDPGERERCLDLIANALRKVRLVKSQDKKVNVRCSGCGAPLPMEFSGNAPEDRDTSYWAGRSRGTPSMDDWNLRD